MEKHRHNAVVAYAVACACGKEPSLRDFELHLLLLFSGVTISQVNSEQINAMAEAVRDKLIDQACEQLDQLIKVAAPNLSSMVPGFGTVVGIATGIITGFNDAKDFGNKARDFYMNAPLEGVWRSGNGSTYEEITISGNSAVFSSFNYTNPLFKDAVNKGFYKIGGVYWRNLTSTGNLTWSGQYLGVRHNTSNPNVATGTSWSNFTIKMSADGKTIDSGGGRIWTRQ